MSGIYSILFLKKTFHFARIFIIVVLYYSNNIFNKGVMMAKKQMTKSQIISVLAEKNDLSKKQMAEILESFAELAYKEAKNSFTLPGLGKLVLVNRKARMGRNPATGETIKIPAKRVVKFRVAKACKDSVLLK